MEATVDRRAAAEIDRLPGRYPVAVWTTVAGWSQRPPTLRRLSGAKAPSSFRARIGGVRLCLIVGPGRCHVTTVFLKRRPADYRRALQRHDALAQRFAAF